MYITTSTAVETLKAALRGELLDPSHPDYERARARYNAMIDKHPALITRCVDAAGKTLGGLDHATHAFDLAVPSGSFRPPGSAG